MIISMNLIEHALKELGANGAELARMIDVTQPTVSRWKTGAAEIPGPVKILLAKLIAERAAGNGRAA